MASIDFSACVELDITSNSAVQPPVTEIRQNMKMQNCPHLRISATVHATELAMASIIGFSACVELGITSNLCRATSVTEIRQNMEMQNCPHPRISATVHATELAMASIELSACVELDITSNSAVQPPVTEIRQNMKMQNCPHPRISATVHATELAIASIEFSACVELDITSNSAVQPPVTEIRQNMKMQNCPHLRISATVHATELAMASIEFSACVVELDITSDSAV